MCATGVPDFRSPAFIFRPEEHAAAEHSFERITEPLIVLAIQRQTPLNQDLSTALKPNNWVLLPDGRGLGVLQPRTA